MFWQAWLVCLVTYLATASCQTVEGLDDNVLAEFFPPPGGEQQEEQEECICMPFYQCANGTFNEYGSGLLDIRINECDTSIKKCCHRPKSDAEKWLLEPTLTPDTPQVCGERNVHGIGFQITGASDGEANFGEFPWMVALLVSESADTPVYTCGGSLISDQVVLTAAHCIGNVDASSWIARAGEWDTQTEDEQLKHVDKYVTRIIKHEQYNQADLRNDIALMILETPIEHQPHIGTVCLPQQDEYFDGSRCFASGWGKNNFGQHGIYQVILKSIELPIVRSADCLKALKKTRLGQFFKLHSSFICAGGEKDKDVCKGDGGGPLVCPLSEDPPHYVLAGIVAWGIGCGEEGIPGVYASVAKHRTWIDNKMNELGFGTESYTRQ